MGAAGAEVVGVDWRLPLAEASRRIGPAYAVQGNLDPALLSAPWPVLAERVREVLRSGAAAPGHIFNLGHGVPPETDPDVLARIVDLVHTEGPELAEPRRGSGSRPACDDHGRRRRRRDHRAGRGPAAGAAGLEVTVLEQGRRWGGKLAPLELDGVRLDGGAESMLARRPEATALAAASGSGRALVHPTGARPARAGRRRAAPDAALAAGGADRRRPTPRAAEPDGLPARRGEPDRPAPALGPDAAIGAVVDDRFGPEVTDRLLEPLLGGVYAGRRPRAVLRRGQPRPVRAGADRRLAAASTPGRRSSGPMPAPVFAGLVGGLSTAGRRRWSRTWNAPGSSCGSGTTVRALDRDRRAVPADRRAGAAPGDDLRRRGAAGRAGGPAGRLLAGLAGTAPELVGGRRTPRSPWSPWSCAAWASDGSGILVPPGGAADDQGADLLRRPSGAGWPRPRPRTLGAGRRGGPGQPRPGRRGGRAAAGRPGAAGAHVRRGRRTIPGWAAGRAGRRRGDPVGRRAAAVPRSATATWWPGCAPIWPACPDWRWPVRRWTGSASPPAWARRTRRWPRSPPISVSAAVAGSTA